MDDAGTAQGGTLIDARGAGCAEVLIRLAAAARQDHSPHDVLVRTDDAGAPEELPAWCRMTGHHFHALLAGTADTYRLTLHPSKEFS